jgi:hypothetical protein
MKKMFLILTLNAVVTFSLYPNERPQCGTSEHCYTRLKYIQSLSPEMRKAVLEKIKSSSLQYAQVSLEMMNKALETALYKRKMGADMSSDANVFLNDLRTKTDQLMGEVFGCEGAFDWTQRKKNGELSFSDVKEFNCAEVMDNALKNDKFQYPAPVAKWLKKFKVKPQAPKKPALPSTGNWQFDESIRNIESALNRSHLTQEEKRKALNEMKNTFLQTDSQVKGILQKNSENVEKLNDILNQLNQQTLFISQRQNLMKVRSTLNDASTIGINLRNTIKNSLKECNQCQSKKQISTQDLKKTLNSLQKVLALNVKLGAKIKEASSFLE